VGSPLAAFFSADLAQIPDQAAYLLFMGLFLILAILGTTTILQLARLRAAWYESMLAMNHMKDFLIKNSDSDISGAFRWTFNTAPAKFKPNSISFYQALEVAILAGLLFGAFIFFLLQSLGVRNDFGIWIIAVVIGMLFTGLQIYLYRRFLK
jgi:hypothetical protein